MAIVSFWRSEELFQTTRRTKGDASLTDFDAAKPRAVGDELFARVTAEASVGLRRVKIGAVRARSRSGFGYVRHC